jgi:hypothetical protein
MDVAFQNGFVLGAFVGILSVSFFFWFMGAVIDSIEKGREGIAKMTDLDMLVALTRSSYLLDTPMCIARLEYEGADYPESAEVYACAGWGSGDLAGSLMSVVRTELGKDKSFYGTVFVYARWEMGTDGDGTYYPVLDSITAIDLAEVDDD